VRTAGAGARRAGQAAHDANRHGLRVAAEGIANGQAHLAGPHPRTPQRQGVRPLAVQRQHGDVGDPIHADDAGQGLRPAVERDRDRGLDVGDDVMVGDDVAARVDEEAGPAAAAIRGGTRHRHGGAEHPSGQVGNLPAEPGQHTRD